MDQGRYRELTNLAAAACEGPLGAEDQRRLDAILTSDEEARVVWLSFAWLHSELSFQTRAEAVRSKAIQSIQESRLHPLHADHPDTVPSPKHPVTPSAHSEATPSSNRATWWLLAIAASIVVAVSLAPRWGGPVSKVAQLPVQSDTESTTPAIWAERQPRPVATVVRAASFEEVENSDASGQLLAASEVIFEGDRFDLESGEAKLSMASGANVLLVAPASLIATSGNRVELRHGELTAKLEKWATGFVVDTPAMTVTDLGTTFSVSAESEDAGEARVLEGLVTVRARAEGAEKQGGLVLAEGDEVRVEGERTERRIDTGKREQDAETLIKLNRERPYKPIFIPSSGQGIRVGDEDPYWRIVSAPEESGYSIPRYAVVSVEHERHARNEPDKSQWISLASDCPNVVANSIYTFATTFDLTGYNHHSARIQCQVLADNGVRAVRVNGQSLDIEPWVDNEFGQVFARNEFRALLIDKGLRAGLNEIEFDVWNGGEAGGPKNEIVAKPNPTAIRVEWHAFGVPLPAGTP